MKTQFCRAGFCRWGMAVVGGGLWSAAFPHLGWAGLAWIAPGWILFGALGTGGKRAFGLGYAAGLAQALTSLAWLLHMPFPFGAVSGWLALSAYLALYPALWVWGCWRLFPARPDDTGPTPGDRYSAVSLPHRVLWAVGCAGWWTALELVKGRFLTGFPWNDLGVSQYQMLPVAQLAAVTGVPGITFLVTWFSVAAAGAVTGLVGGGLARPISARDDLAFGGNWRLRLGLVELLPPVLALAGTLHFGMRQLSRPDPDGPALKVALVQPSIPQTLIWNPAENDYRFRRLLEWSALALRSRPDLLVWPEAAVPNLLRFETNTLAAVTNLARSHRVWMIVGADDAEPSRRDANAVDYYNASFLISPTGTLRARYCKQRLVAFGEYIPLVRWLPFLRWFTPIEGGFTPGRQAESFVLTQPRANISVLICFEDTFPGLARTAAEPDTDFLLNLTNNGWFGESAAQWQHAANAVFRAIENGLPLVRCANNGLTCWVDARGRMQEVYFPGSTDIYAAGIKTFHLPLHPPGAPRPTTFYHRHGDWFGWGCVGGSLVVAAIGEIRRRYGRPS